MIAIDGGTFSIVCSDKDAETNFFTLAALAKTVIFGRFSPQ